MLNVVFFASLKEQLGVSAFSLKQPDNVQDIAGLVAYLIAENPNWQGVLDAPNIRTALNHEVCDSETQLKGDDEVAFFPPVTGG